MANQYFADVPKGFSVPKQIRLDYKTNVQNEETLKDLGPGNRLAFTYYENLEVYCKEEKTTYVWREVEGIELGLLTTNFVYPNYPPIDGIDYSGKSFNFFLVNENQTPADGSETKLLAGQNINITGQGTVLNPYQISSTFVNELTFIESGTNIDVVGSGSEEDPYIINSTLIDLGLVRELNNRIIAPNQTLSLIGSDITGKVLVTKEYVDNITIPTVDGSETKIIEGSNVLITGTGTQSNPYVISSTTESIPTVINSTEDIQVNGLGTLENPYTFFNLGLDLKANLESPTFTGTVTAPIIIGNLTGNATTATKLETSMTINNVPFDGSSSITIVDDTREPRLNKQNSLLADGTGNKFVTVDAVNEGLLLKLNTGGYIGTAQDLENQILQIILPNEVTKTGTVNINDLVISVNADEFHWRINQIEFTDTPEFSSVIQPASNNFFRSDLLQGDNFGEYSIKQGVEGEFSSTAPDPDINNIALAVINVQGSTINDPTPAPDLDSLYFKRFKQTYKTSQPVFDINPNEDDYNIIFTNTNPTVIKIYPNGSFGKFIKNNSTHPLKSLGSGTVTVQAEPGVILNAPNGLILNPGQQCYLIKDDENEWTFVNPSFFQNLDIKEDIANKQNSLAVDATNLKYPTVTAVNAGLATKVSSTATTNFIPKVNAGGNLENSRIFDNGTNFGFGTETPVTNASATMDGAAAISLILRDSGGTGSGFVAQNNTQIANNERLGYALFGGLDNSNNSVFASGISSNASTAWTPTSRPANLMFETTNITGARAVRGQFNARGAFLVNQVVDNGTDIAQFNGTVKALPATTSDQLVTLSQVQNKVSSTATNTFIPKVSAEGNLENSIISQPVANRIDVAGGINLPTANTLVTFGGITGLFPGIGKLSNANALIALKADNSDFVPLGYSQGNATIGYRTGNLGVIGFTNSAGNPLQAGTVDTAISRLASGRFAFGNGNLGNTTGQIIAAKGLFNTSTDDGVNVGIFNGTISVATATQPNQAPRLEQVVNTSTTQTNIVGRKTFQNTDITHGGVDIINNKQTIGAGESGAGLTIFGNGIFGQIIDGSFQANIRSINTRNDGVGIFSSANGNNALTFAGLNGATTTFSVTKEGVVTASPATTNTQLTTLGQIKSRDGWASYSTTTFTNASPFTVAPNTTVTLPNNANNSITTDLPLGVTAFYNGTTNKITPVAVGDAYTVNVRFKARTTMNNDYLTLFIDIGNGSQINAEAKQFLKGANTEQPFSFTMPIFTLATFVANGGLIKVASNGGTISIYDVTFYINRNYTR